MKTWAIGWLAWTCLAGSSFATPDHSITVDERFFGSNATEYAVVRTEVDNLCSYYQSRVTTWLDEYSKEDTQREKVRSTLLLDVSRHRDADHADPDTPVPVTEELNSKDGTLKLATLLERYPTLATVAWTPEMIAKMTVDPKSGIRFRNREFITSDAVVSMVLFGQRHPDEDWQLDGVSGDSNCIYLQLSIGQDENPEKRVMCVAPGISKRVMDQAGMQPVYLVAGTFETREAAVARALDLRKLASERKNYSFHPEVWSMLPATDKITYLVTDGASKELIESGRIPQVEEELGIDFLPVSSERFMERIPMTRE